MLYWLRTSKPLSVFVANRVKEIKSLEGVKFAYVISTDNPADMAMRESLLKNSPLPFGGMGPFG